MMDRNLPLQSVQRKQHVMKTLSLDLPALYGDHHVTEVRRILFELPGVEAVYASSSFHVVEVTYDPAHVDEETIVARLSEAGYLDSLDMPLESQKAPYQEPEQVASFRHTAAYAQTRQTVSFAHQVAYSGRPLWPCPGMGLVEKVDEGE
jgi:copper chaperone CopZ